jgi:hypothetical protein
VTSRASTYRSRLVALAALAGVWAGQAALPAGSGAATSQCTPSGLDSSAKDLARTAQIVAETYATDHNGSYVGLSPAVERRYESAVPIRPSRGQAYLSSARGTKTGYTVVVTAGANTFTIRNRNGIITRTWRGSMGPGCVSNGSGTW